MPSVLAPTYLEANLAAFGSRNASAAEAIRNAAPAPEIEFIDTPQNAPSAIFGGRTLASKHRPLDEADRIAGEVDLEKHAVVVALGFGLGHHVRRLAERMGKAGVIVVFEPDVALLRAVLERVDHASWMRESLLVWMTKEDDRAGLVAALSGAESIVGQGLAFVEHPASRSRLGERAVRFSSLVREYVGTARTTLMTTLMRSAHTCRNLMANLDHYALGPGVADLKDAARGFPAVVVSAGPSLHRNVHELARPGVRERCVIVAVQTTLKPLLEAGIKPHFVTALDYHEISRRFYEGLTASDVEGVTLLADPRAHPVILDSFPGRVRCCASPFLDKLLGPHAREMGRLPHGATVAHLAFYVARYLGCASIGLVGQDLAFTDGLYYAPGNPIHRIWAPELNSFNTLEMMEWQRVVRHRQHLAPVQDHAGRTVYTDAQMLAYLHQFERDFADARAAGVEVVDATEGGAVKQHATIEPLASFLDRATRPLPAWSCPDDEHDPARRRAVRQRLRGVRRDVDELRRLSRETVALLERMLKDRAKEAAMSRHFRRLDALKARVEPLFETFELLNNLNQLGVFKRHRSDRRIHLARSLPPKERQRAQLERDRENVGWTVEAADEFLDLLDDADAALVGEPAPDRPDPRPEAARPRAAARVAAVVPVDPERNGLGVRRRLDADFFGETVLQATLRRLGRLRRIESIVLVVPDSLDVDSILDPSRVDRPVEIERVPGSPFASGHEAIAAARVWGESSWRGAIAGTTAWDEVLCPETLSPIVDRRGLDAILLVAPDWPLVDVSPETGADALVDRFLEAPDGHNLVFTQAPPGLSACLLSARLLREFRDRNRSSTVGGVLVYQPHAPQHDPIARQANVQIDAAIRHALVRATFDDPARAALLLERLREVDRDEPAAVARALDPEGLPPPRRPRHLLVELTSRRADRGLFDPTRRWPGERGPLDLTTLERLVAAASDDEADDLRVTFAGPGDPLLHPRFDDAIRIAREAGARSIHLRTALLAPHESIDRLLASPLDVLSVDLHADRAATHRVMMGVDRFEEVLRHFEHLIVNRRRFTAHAGGAALALPWIVPRLQRRAETLEDLDPFFDRWLRILGTAVIEGPPPFDASDDSLTPARPPSSVYRRELRERMLVLADGRVPASEMDPLGPSVGDAAADDLPSLWRRLVEARAALRARHGDDHELLRTAFP